MVDVDVAQVGQDLAAERVRPATADDVALLAAAPGLERERDLRLLNQHLAPGVLAVVVVVDPIRPVIPIVGREDPQAAAVSVYNADLVVGPRPDAVVGAEWLVLEQVDLPADGDEAVRVVPGEGSQRKFTFFRTINT